MDVEQSPNSGSGLMDAKPVKAARPSVFSQVSQLQSAVHSSQKYILGSVAVVFMVLAVQFVLTVVAFDMSKDTNVNSGMLVDKTSGEVVRTVPYQPLDITPPKILNMAYLHGMKTISIEEGYSLAMEHEVLGREVRPCPASGSTCCEERFGLAYLLYTSHYVFAAKQSAPDAEIKVGICNDEHFLNAMKVVSNEPESKAERSRKLLQIDQTTYTTSCHDDGKGGLACECDNCQSMMVTDWVPGCVSFFAPPHGFCATWQDRQGYYHQTNVAAGGPYVLNSFMDNWDAGAGQHVEAPLELFGQLMSSYRSSDALADYCLNAKFGGLGRIYGYYKINKCEAPSLQEDYWNTLVPEYLHTHGFYADVWGWVHEYGADTSAFDSSSFHDAIYGSTGHWTIDDLSFIFWHSYTFSALQHGGLAGQCQYCFACRQFTLAWRDGNVLDEPWLPNKIGMTGPFTAKDFHDYTMRIGYGVIAEDFSRDKSNKCTQFLLDGFSGGLKGGADTGYSGAPSCDKTPYMAGCAGGDAGHKH